MLTSYVFARRSEGVAWHLQGRLTEEGCEAHRTQCQQQGWDVTNVQKIEVEVDLLSFDTGEKEEPRSAFKC